MPTLARLSFWVPPQRMAEFEAAYREKVAPILKRHGLVESSERGRATKDYVFSRLFEFKTPSEVANAWKALWKDPAYQEVLRSLWRSYRASLPDSLLRRAQSSKEPWRALPAWYPTQLSMQQVRDFERHHANLAFKMAATFSAILRSPVDVDIAFVDQTTCAESIQSLDRPSCSYVFSIEPLKGQAVLFFSFPVALQVVGQESGLLEDKSWLRAIYPLLEDKSPSRARNLTAHERGALQKVTTSILADLETSWRPMLGIQALDPKLRMNPESIQMARPSESVLLIAFLVRSKYGSGLVYLCYPFTTLDPIISMIRSDLTIYAALAGPGKAVPAGPGKEVYGIDRKGLWYTYKVKDGLADSTVSSICQDRDGHLWFGTQNGVSRYGVHSQKEGKGDGDLA